MARRLKILVGDVVAITWIDSGMELRTSQADAKTTKLKRAIAYGRVVDVDEERVVLVHDDGGEDDSHSTYGLIWIPAIKKIEKLK